MLIYDTPRVAIFRSIRNEVEDRASQIKIALRSDFGDGLINIEINQIRRNLIRHRKYQKTLYATVRNPNSSGSFRTIISYI